MNDQVKKAMEPLGRFWGNTSKTVKRILVGSLIAVAVLALGLSVMLNTKEYVVIFSEVSPVETSEILTKLQEMKVDVKLNDGGEIMVLAQDEATVRMNLATQGYPKSGLGYAMEEDTSMLSTDYERKQTHNRSLQERMAASIETLDGVKQAIVTITQAEENVFYLQSKEEPSASVIVHMKDGYTLTEGQVTGIINLVSKSVLGLEKENIALTDGQGNELASAPGGSADGGKVKITNEIENQIKKKVSAVLQGPYDISQFKVSVTAVVDTDKMIREELTYAPSPDGDNSGVKSSESRSDESSSSTQSGGGVPGTTTNSDVPEYPVGGGTGESTTTATSEQIDYLVSTIKEQTEKTGAYIDSVSIGIAIDKAAFDPGEQENVVSLVAYAAGVPPESVMVQNFKFYKEDPGEEEPLPKTNTKMLIIGIAAAVLLLIACIVLFVLLRKRKKAQEAMALEEQEALERQRMLAELRGVEPDEDMEKRKLSPVKNSRREEIKEFATDNPEITAQMIRTWLRNEND